MPSFYFCVIAEVTKISYVEVNNCTNCTRLAKNYLCLTGPFCRMTATCGIIQCWVRNHFRRCEHNWQVARSAGSSLMSVKLQSWFPKSESSNCKMKFPRRPRVLRSFAHRSSTDEGTSSRVTRLISSGERITLRNIIEVSASAETQWTI